MAVKRKKTAARAKKAIRRKTAPAKRAKPKSARRGASAAKRARAALPKGPEASLERIGEVTHYFPKVKAAAMLILKDSLKVGDAIYVKGHTTDFKDKVSSMQVDHVPVEEGKKGQEIGLLVKSRVRIGDSVYKI
jgi:putative protease